MEKVRATRLEGHSNESALDLDVFFDDLKITHIQHPIVQEMHYYPFGLTMRGIGKQGSNPFKFNGKEEQDELNLGWMDYGARMYDAALGRWHVADPESGLSQSWTPYRYGFDNPIRYWDVDGKFEMDPEQAKTYKRLAQYLQYGIQGVGKNSRIVNALMRYGQLSSGQIQNDLKWNEGPKVVIANTDGNGRAMGNSMGRYIGGDKLYLNEKYVKELETATGARREALLFRLAQTILHEYVHYGDAQDGVDQPGEEGDKFDLAAYGFDIESIADAKKVLEQWKQEQKKKAEEQKEKSEGAKKLLNDASSGNLEEGTYVWNGSKWVAE